ncbi:LysR family transcriptional regulator [Psychromonas sp. MB-3u-54]|uniref:LysR family transcriptional regulator n=1 Tax=Psychromonas sp. MB-3u-54 TaxID=2058319 RepID=UPI000C325BA0|nr:LysR family transcriptional regulator [Psychromonas sp. MB-3u-54]PKH01936.1 LysR family transcriptional regulator [Psychromonas sp. MB-3u-54]
MNITIKQIRTFLAVVKVNSFVEASELLHLSQPALSTAIKKLEETVGGKLLARSTRTLALTPEGEIFLPVARRLLADFDNAFIELHDLFSLQHGNLSLSAMPSFASTHLPQHLLSFNKEYPAIKVKIHDVIAEDAVKMVQTGKVEFAISFDPDTSDDLSFETLFSDKFVAAFSKNHKLMKVKKVGWQHLIKHPFITLKHPSSIRLLMDNILAEQNIFLNVTFETNQLATVVQMVATELGVSVIPSLYKQQMQALNLEFRELSSPVISRRVGIITRRRYPLSQTAQAFIEILRSYYQ